MSTIVRVGNRQLSAELICQQVSKSQLLPQLLREMIIDDIVSHWEPSSDLLLTVEPEDRQLGALSTDAEMPDLKSVQMANRALKLQQFKQSVWGHKLGSYYLARKSQLDRVVCSMMQVSDGIVAQELFFRVQANEQSFAKLAVKYSQGVTAIDGGRLGPIAISQLHPTIADRLMRIQPGQLSQLFTIGNNYIFVRLEQMISAQFDDRLRQFLLDELFEKWLQAKIAAEIGLISVNPDMN